MSSKHCRERDVHVQRADHVSCALLFLLNFSCVQLCNISCAALVMYMYCFCQARLSTVSSACVKLVAGWLEVPALLDCLMATY
jgi:hypothetical protein